MGVEGSRAVRPGFNGFNTMWGSHFRLFTLGRLALDRSDGDVTGALAALNARRRKVAVLAVLALARRPVSRDTLLEMFWGDQDEARARHSLSDAVSHLRRVLGSGAIAATRRDIALAPAAPLVVDAVELALVAEAVTEAAGRITTTERRRLLSLYSGPFLDGVHVEGSSTFEQWVTRERAHLDRVFVRAARAQCKALGDGGDWTGCHEIAERWLAADPLSADAAVMCLESLAALDGGDARALAAYAHLAARLRREYELEPDPAVTEVAERIQKRWRNRAAAVRAEFAAREAGRPPPTTESGTDTTGVYHPPAAPRIIPPTLSRPLPARPQIAVALLATLLVASAFVATRSQSSSSPPTPSTGVVSAGVTRAGHMAVLDYRRTRSKGDISRTRAAVEHGPRSTSGWHRHFEPSDGTQPGSTRRSRMRAVGER